MKNTLIKLLFILMFSLSLAAGPINTNAYWHHWHGGYHWHWHHWHWNHWRR